MFFASIDGSLQSAFAQNDSSRSSLLGDATNYTNRVRKEGSRKTLSPSTYRRDCSLLTSVSRDLGSFPAQPWSENAKSVLRDQPVLR
jgi:hypothetical protein